MNMTLLQPIVNKQDINLNQAHKEIFNGYDCGGMDAEFVDKIAYAESRGGCKNGINDYGCVNKSGSSFGRYQMQRPALIDAGYMNKEGQFLPKTGLKNMQDFLHNPLAQDKAMCNYLEKADQYNKNWNNYKYLNQNVRVGELNIPLTKNMMLAGTHREGAKKLNDWLNDIEVQNDHFVRNTDIDRSDIRRQNLTNRFREILYPPK